MIVLPKGSLITLAGTQLTEHNRTALQLDRDERRVDTRLANGSMRRYFVATKLKFSFTWTMLPALDSLTADGKAGRNTIRGIYDSNIDNELALVYKIADGSNVEQNTNATVFIDTYTETLQKRWGTQYWDVNIVLTEK